MATFSSRVRFNWGYHDGAHEQQRNQPRDMQDHFCPNYAAGYRLGQRDQLAGNYAETSEPAWQEHCRTLPLVYAIEVYDCDSRQLVESELFGDDGADAINEFDRYPLKDGHSAILTKNGKSTGTSRTAAPRGWAVAETSVS